MKSVSPEDAYLRMTALCSRGERCRGDVLQKLCSFGLTQGQALPIVERLERENYISEERYALAFVRDKVRFNLWGPHRVAYELARKGISSAVTCGALDQLPEGMVSQALTRLLERGQARLKADIRAPERARRLREMALRYGFSPDGVSDFLRKIGNAEEDADFCENMADD